MVGLASICKALGKSLYYHGMFGVMSYVISSSLEIDQPTTMKVHKWFL